MHSDTCIVSLPTYSRLQQYGLLEEFFMCGLLRSRPRLHTFSSYRSDKNTERTHFLATLLL